MVVPTNSEAVCVLNACKTLLHKQHDYMQTCGLVNIALEVTFSKTIREINDFLKRSTISIQLHTKPAVKKITFVKEELAEKSISNAFVEMGKDQKVVLSIESEDMDELDQFEMIQDAPQSNDLRAKESNEEKENVQNVTVSTAIDHLNDLQGKLEAEVNRQIELQKMKNDLPFQCEICRKIFPTFRQFQRHDNFHTGEKPYPCKICNRRFRLDEYLRKHMMNVHPDKSTWDGEVNGFSCEYCSKIFPTETQLNKHVLALHPKNKSQSADEDEVEIDYENPMLAEDSTTDLDKEENNSDSKTAISALLDDKIPFQCKVCAKVFKHVSKLKRHANIHSDVKPFQCTKCGRNFRLHEYLQKHLRNVHNTYTGEKAPNIIVKMKPPKPKFQCKTCSKVFNHACNLERHANIHTGEKPYECRLCGKRFRIKTYLDDHQVRVHSDEVNDPTKKVYATTGNDGFNYDLKQPKRKLPTCTICNKKFFRPHLLRGHMLVHTGERPFSCSYCNRRFRLKHILSEHLLTHTGEKPHECKVCHKRFRQRGTLHGHMRCHTGEKPFKCDFCEQAFAYQNSLIAHKRVHHTFERPYLCEFCPSSFRTGGGLRRHVRCHTGAKPYECPNCSRKFAGSSGLRRHILTHSDEKPFRCEICFAGFRQLSNMRGHIRRIHLK